LEAVVVRSLTTSVGVVVLLSVAAPLHGQGAKKPRTEKAKIEALLKHVEGLKDARFIRNDQEYNADTAAKYLQGKWEAHTNEVKTAKDFIEKIASKSSTTGRPYMVRFKDGQTKKSADYLLAELKKLER
jgi:Family of unknown function (DUF5329)